MHTIDQELAAIFAGQHCLITRRQALGCGVSGSAIDRRVRSGRWEVAERGVYALNGVPWTWHRHLAAVVLSVSRAMASHRAAATVLEVGGLRRPPIELVVPDGASPRRGFHQRERRAGRPVVVHEAEDHPLEPPIVVGGIPTTPPLRLAVDVGATMTFDQYQRLVGDLRRRHGVTWADLDRTWRAHSRQGRNGCGALHELLDRHFGAQGAPAEVIEARCVDLLVDAGLPEPACQFEIQRPDGRIAILDLAYPDLRIAIETEGRIHDWDDVRQTDHTRRNNLLLLGWVVLHFTWEDVVHRPAYVVGVVRNAIDQRTREFCP